MEREKVRAYIWIGIVSIFLGIIISFQVKVIRNKLLQGYSSNIRSNQLVAQLENVKNEKTIIEEEINALRIEFKNLKESTSKENLLVESLNNELEKAKKFAGMTDVQGEGIEILISDNIEEYNTGITSIVQEYNLILSLINELNAAGAEAISINNQRIVNGTEIRTAGNNLMVNSVPLVAPLSISAIGNSNTLSASLNQRFGIVSIIRDKGYFLETARVEKNIIEKYDGKIIFNYIENYQE